MTDFKVTHEAIEVACDAYYSQWTGDDIASATAMKAALEAALPVMFEERAHLHPHIVSFNNVERTSCPAHILSVIEGNVAWSAEVGCGDSGGVIDKHGVHHRQIPLYAIKEPK